MKTFDFGHIQFQISKKDSIITWGIVPKNAPLLKDKKPTHSGFLKKGSAEQLYKLVKYLKLLEEKI
tara:strand:+ start:1784 stop:1981 length:198 start_codon:yes stop_codon:yes gene_type:complete